MNAILKLVVDDETRRSIREIILGEAKSLARSLIDATVQEEMRSVVSKLEDRYLKSEWLFKGLVRESILTVLNDKWHSEIVGRIDNIFTQKAEAFVASAVEKAAKWVVAEAVTKEFEAKGKAVVTEAMNRIIMAPSFREVIRNAVQAELANQGKGW